MTNLSRSGRPARCFYFLSAHAPKVADSSYSVPASDIQSKYPSIARKKFSFIRNFLKFSLRSTLVRSLLNSLKIECVLGSTEKTLDGSEIPLRK